MMRMTAVQVRKRYWLIAVLTMALLVAGCSSSGDKQSPQDIQTKAFHDFKAQLTLVIDDQSREGALLKIIDELEVDVNKLLSAISKRRQGFDDLNADYNATREEFTVFFSTINNNIQQQSKKVTTKYRRMQKLLTNAEQNKLNKYNSDLIKSFVNLLKAA